MDSDLTQLSLPRRILPLPVWDTQGKQLLARWSPRCRRTALPSSSLMFRDKPGRQDRGGPTRANRSARGAGQVPG